MSDGDHFSDDLDWDEVARVLGDSEGCFAIVPDQENTKPKRGYDLPHPSKRTKEQHAAHMMRERNTTMTSRRAKQSEEQASNAGAFFLLDRRAKIEQVRGVVSIVGADSCRRFPAATTIKMAHTQQIRTADVAKTFDCDPSVVTQARAVVARASCTQRNPPDTFVVSLAADATQETWTLNLILFVDAESVGAVAAVLLVVSRGSALGRLRCELPERATVG